MSYQISDSGDQSHRASNTPVKLFVSPCLECDLSDAARKIMLEYVRPMFTGATLVDNPHGSRCLPGYACEVHGAKNAGRGQLVDLDGEDYDSIDSRGFGNNNTDAEMALAWKLCNNGLKKGEDFRRHRTAEILRLEPRRPRLLGLDRRRRAQRVEPRQPRRPAGMQALFKSPGRGQEGLYLETRRRPRLRRSAAPARAGAAQSGYSA